MTQLPYRLAFPSCTVTYDFGISNDASIQRKTGEILMNQEFLAQTLNSNQLLALLYVCENKRKGTGLKATSFKGHGCEEYPKDWNEMLDTFSSRLGNLSESLRFEVLEAHLMSVEDIDIYHDETLRQLLEENQEFLEVLTGELGRDKRFQLNS